MVKIGTDNGKVTWGSDVLIPERKRIFQHYSFFLMSLLNILKIGKSRYRYLSEEVEDNARWGDKKWVNDLLIGDVCCHGSGGSSIGLCRCIQPRVFASKLI